MLITVVKIMVSFTLVIVKVYERSTPPSTALILLNPKMYILLEWNLPTYCNRNMKFQKNLIFDQDPELA